jgi:hypothetical protein
LAFAFAKSKLNSAESFEPALPADVRKASGFPVSRFILSEAAPQEFLEA